MFFGMGAATAGRLLAASLLYSVHFCSSFNTCRLAVVPHRVVSWQPDLSTKEALRGRRQKPQGKSERDAATRAKRWQVAEQGERGEWGRGGADWNGKGVPNYALYTFWRLLVKRRLTELFKTCHKRLSLMPL